MSMIDPTHDVVVQAAERLHRDVIRFKGDLAMGAFKLGEALAKMQDSRAYTALGFATFEEYLAGPEVTIHRATAYQFVRVYRTYHHVVLGRHWETIDVRKLDILSRLLEPETDPERIEALVEQARELPREELRAAVNEEVRRKGLAPPGEYQPPARLAVVPPAPPAPHPARTAEDDFGHTLGAWLAADPAYQQSVLKHAALTLVHRLRSAAYGSSDLLHHRSPEEVAAALSPEEAAQLAQDFARTVGPMIAWVERVIAAGQAPGVRRVK